jgi:hypothetical protein
MLWRYSLVSSGEKEGLARVSDDGQVIINEEGSGIGNGGWHIARQ